MDGESEPSQPTNLFATPSPVVQNTTTMLPPETRSRKNRSDVWNHFKLDPNLEKIAICNYCDKKFKYNGTSSMAAHSKACKSNPNNDFNKRQRTLTPSMNGDGHPTSSPSVPRFDQERLRYLLVKLFIAWELPFSKVEHPDFHEFVSGLNSKFNLISHTTLARDTLLLWDVEKEKLKNFLALHCQRVCLTSDTWTSIQNLTYMCITVHFIDNNWTLQNRVLSFVQVTGHSGDIIANTIDACLTDWVLNQILTVTLDNASSNDLAIKHLTKKLLSCNRLVLNGEYIHMRCCAHILNLIVKEGFKDLDKSILRIRGSVKYAKSSAQRFAKFKECVKRSNTEYKGLACLDVETRWNSTYLMLDSALKHQKAFEVLEIHDPMYTQELVQKGNGVPTSLDWIEAQSILPF
ncbi:zinc finger BED domain-containing protein RICESLEEPER 2-like [Vicia villosa]|uniref:zinc finger BED domain-containing protein RICESLEEPER 2-like n=1 Tax=Vicia villosa TaxID=3911 RepID=UPI00273C274A|nr:zinc finger BED domain-containing protein RICESLEEPER 2-like [Vicia villosa]